MSEEEKPPQAPDEDAIGYRRPPRQHRWKPGQSGNPRGRRKGARGFKTDRNELLDLPVRATEDGRQRTLTTQQAVLRTLRAKAIKGDNRAMDRLLELARERHDEIEAHDHARRADSVREEDRAALERALARLAPGQKQSP